jgi:hypothetical protein
MQAVIATAIIRRSGAQVAAQLDWIDEAVPELDARDLDIIEALVLIR